MKIDFKIVFLGDNGVGKTTIISSLNNETFIEKVPKYIPEVIILNNDFTCRLIDLDIDDHSTRDLEIKKADAIIIVYSIDRFDSFMNIRAKWLPLINNLKSKNNEVLPPILILGNKLDIIEKENYEQNKPVFEETIEYLSSNYNGSVSWSEITSKDYGSISSGFSLDIIYNKLLFPEHILFDTKTNRLNNKCAKVLQRIFKIIDSNRDGRIDEKEFKDMFTRSKSTLEIFSIDFNDLIETIPTMIPNGSGIIDNGLTEFGFITMISLIVKNNPIKVWNLLRYFRYENDLTLDHDFLVPRFTVPQDHTVSLSDQGITYFTDLFNLYCKESEGLNNADISSMFDNLSPSIPAQLLSYKNSFNTNTNGELTLNGFLSFWSLQTYENYQQTLTYLAYLGCYSNTDMITINRNRILDQKYKNFQRTIIRCLVLGYESSGKTSFLNSFIGSTSDNSKQICCGQVSNNKFLILQEIADSLKTLSQKDKNSNELLQLIKYSDIVCLLYDQNNQDSFKYVESIYNQISNNYKSLPIVFIQQKPLTPDPTIIPNKAINQFLKKLGKQPKEFSLSSSNSIYHDLVKEVEDSINLPCETDSSSSSSSQSSIIKVAALIGGISIAAAVVYTKWFKA